MSDIPQWAMERAQDLFHHEQPEITPLQWRNAFARYIAAHEEAPVDPLLIEAREIVKAGLSISSHSRCNCRKEIEAGEWDKGGKVSAALSGIKRGMELAREQIT